MAAFFYLEDTAVINHRHTILVNACCSGKREQTVDFGEQRSVKLDCRHKLRHGKNQIIVDFLLQSQNFLFGTHNLLLILLQLLGYVAFGVDKRLFANPVLRYLVAVGVAYLNVVPENVVEAHFQRRDAGFKALALLQFQKIVASFICNVAQLVKLGIHTAFYGVAFGHLHRRVNVYLVLNLVAD